MQKTLIIILYTLSLTVFSQTHVHVVVSKPASLETYILEEESSHLKHLHSLKIPETPMTIAVSNNKKYLYLGLRDSGGKGKLLTVSATDTPELISEIKLDFQVRYMAPDKTGNFILFADYFGGKVGVIKTKNQIPTKNLSCLIETEKFAHCIKLSHDNKFAYAPHTGPNKVYQFSFDSQSGKLSLNGTVEGPRNIEGNRAPRHIDLHPSKPYYYSSNEHKGGISFWVKNSKGKLEMKQSLNTLPKDFKGGSTAADIHVSPDGKYVYVSNRGGKDASSKLGTNTLAAYSIDQSTGKLNYINHFPASQRPRSFAISSNGDFLASAGQADKKIFLFKRNVNNGNLVKISEYSLPGKANWLIFHKQ